MFLHVFRAKDEINLRKKLETSKVGYLRRAVWGSFTQRIKTAIQSPSSDLGLEIGNHFEHLEFSKALTFCLTATASGELETQPQNLSGLRVINGAYKCPHNNPRWWRTPHPAWILT